MTIRIKPDLDILTIDDLLQAETGKLLAMVKVYSKCVVDEDGEYMSAEEGEKTIRKLTINQLKSITAALVEEIKGEVPPN